MQAHTFEAFLAGKAPRHAHDCIPKSAQGRKNYVKQLRVPQEAAQASPSKSKYNEPIVNKMPESEAAPPQDMCEDERTRCGYCKKVLERSKCYVYRGELYCDDCVWFLGENGEFYCGD